MTKKDKIKISILMPSFEEFKNPPIPELKDYFKLDLEESTGLIKHTSFLIGIAYSVEEGVKLPGNLPGLSYDPKKPAQGVKLSEEVEEWMKTQPTGNIYCSAGYVMMFEKEQDLSWFLLKFGDHLK